MNKAIVQVMIQELNIETRVEFSCLGEGEWNYTRRQKDYAISLVDIHGVRATSRILEIPRRTIQRWCRQYHHPVKRCPSWVYEWAERRQRRREFWERRGY